MSWPSFFPADEAVVPLALNNGLNLATQPVTDTTQSLPSLNHLNCTQNYASSAVICQPPVGTNALAVPRMQAHAGVAASIAQQATQQRALMAAQACGGMVAAGAYTQGCVPGVAMPNLSGSYATRGYASGVGCVAAAPASCGGAPASVSASMDHTYGMSYGN